MGRFNLEMANAGGDGSVFRIYNKGANGQPAVFTSTANRDTYFATNASEFNGINNQPYAVGVGMVAEDASESNVSQWFVLINGIWEDIVGTLAGPAGMGSISQDIPAGTYLMAADDGSGNIVAAASSTVETPTAVATNKTVQSGLRSFRVGDAYEFISSGRTMSVRNIATGEIFRFLVSGNAATPVLLVDRVEQEFDFQALDSSNLINPEFSVVIPAFDLESPENGQYVQGVTLRLDSNSTKTNLFFRLRISGTTFQTYTYPIVAPDEDNNNEFYFEYDPPIDVLVGDNFEVSITSVDGDVILKGDSLTGIPYQRPMVVLFDFMAVASSLEVAALAESIQALQNTIFNSGRSFLRFNDGFTIGSSNLATYEDKNIIYTAKNDKTLDSSTRPDVFLPTDEDIAAAGENYPITFEFTHLGGTVRSTTTNLVRFFTSGELVGQLLRDDAAIVIKRDVGLDYELLVGSFDPNDTLLPTGVFNLKTDTPITDISTISTELSMVTVVAGDAYLVELGGSWSGLTVPDGSILVAIVSSASLVDSALNNDWLLLDNPRVNAKSAAFFANLTQVGVRFNANRNIQIDPSNVLELNSMSSGGVVTREIGSNTQGNNREIRYDNVPIQFTDIVGGRLQISLGFNITSTSGFPPVWRELQLVYPNDIIFTFPIGASILNGPFTTTIDIPFLDYSLALNENVSLRLIYDFNGVSFFGEYSVTGLVNTSKGRLHDAVLFLAGGPVHESEMRTLALINQLQGNVTQENSSLAAIVDRISPYRNNPLVTLYQNARFLNSTGVDAFPSDIGLMSQVSASNPQFTVSASAVFIAVEPNAQYLFKNITQDASIPLDDSMPSVSIGESISFEGVLYFVYRVTGLTSGDVIELDSVELVRVVQWADDISNLLQHVERLDIELKHAALNLPDEVTQILENEITVTEQDAPTIVASDYNKELSANGTQTVFYDANAVINGFLPSSPISDNNGNDQYRNKLLYLNEALTIGGVVLRANNAGVTTDLIEFQSNGQFFAKQFVAAVPAGTQNSTQYMSESSGQGQSADDPIDIVAGIRDSGGNYAPEDVSVSVVRNLPRSNELVTVTIHGFVNGLQEGFVAFDLPYGGDNSADYIVPVGGANAGQNLNLNFRARYANNNTVVFIEVVNTGSNIAVNAGHFKVLLTYTEVRIIPSTPETTRNVYLTDQLQRLSNVFMIIESTDGNVLIVSDSREVNTGYVYSDLFGVNDAGLLDTTIVSSNFMDFRLLGNSTILVNQLQQHSALPQFGLFSTVYNHETIVNLGTQLSVLNSAGDLVLVGQQLVLEDTEKSNRYNVTIKNGVIVPVLIS